MKKYTVVKQTHLGRIVEVVGVYDDPLIAQSTVTEGNRRSAAIRDDPDFAAKLVQERDTQKQDELFDALLLWRVKEFAPRGR